MKILIAGLIMIISVAAHADDFFPDSKIAHLRVIEANYEDGAARVLDKNGNQAEIYIGDTIGIEEGTITDIDDTFITIRTGDATTKLRVIKSREEANADASDIDAPSLGSNLDL